MEKKILVVDDEPLIRKLLETAFTRAGYTVVLAGSGEEALEILKNEPINVMFFDIQLSGMTGIELCIQIRKENSIACIYAMTGSHSLFELSNFREIGFNDFFLKPFSLTTFLKTARDAFEKLEKLKKK